MLSADGAAETDLRKGNPMNTTPEPIPPALAKRVERPWPKHPPLSASVSSVSSVVSPPALRSALINQASEVARHVRNELGKLRLISRDGPLPAEALAILDGAGVCLRVVMTGGAARTSRPEAAIHPPATVYDEAAIHQAIATRRTRDELD
jgi:hypothetical protein